MTRNQNTNPEKVIGEKRAAGRLFWRAFMRGSVVSVIGAGTLGILNFLIRRTMALNLSEVDYGFFYSAFSLVMLAVVFLDMGLSKSGTILLAKHFADNDRLEANRTFSVLFFTKLILALLACIIFAALAPFLARNYFKHPELTGSLLLMVLLIPMVALASLAKPVFAAKKKFEILQILQNSRVLIILLGLMIGLSAYGLNLAILCFVGSALLICIPSFVLIRRFGISLSPWKSLDLSTVKSTFSISMWIALSSAGILVIYYMDTICLTWLKNLKAVAMYNIALPIMQIAQSFFVFPVIFEPFVSEMWHKQNYKGIKRSCLMGNLLILGTVPVFLSCGRWFAEDLIALLFDETFIAAAPAVTALWFGMVFLAAASFNFNALNAGNRQKLVAYMVCLSVPVNLILNILLIPRFNYTGAAWATAGTYVLMYLLSVVCLVVVLRRQCNPGGISPDQSAGNF